MLLLYKVSGQRLVYKFVDLPYNYKPIRKLYDSGILEKDRVLKGKVTQTADCTREAFQVISRQDFKTTKPQVFPVRNECCCGGSRGIGHISVPVIMKCGHPSALPVHQALG